MDTKEDKLVERLEITRSAIELGKLEDFLAKVEQQGLLSRSSRQYRDVTRAEAISQFNPTEDIWLFAYGSLLWNPTIYYEETRHGHLYGLHRKFCLKTVLGRGTPECDRRWQEDDAHAQLLHALSQQPTLVGRRNAWRGPASSMECPGNHKSH